MHMINAAKRFEQKFDAKAERFIWHHPILGSIYVFIGMPLLILAGVCAGTIIVGFPMACALGWL